MRRRGLDLMILLLVTSASVQVGSAALDDDLSGLSELISSFEDAKMDSYDLAFYLATHGYDAVPEDDHVELVLGSETYILTPNGESPELCDLVLKI